MPYHYFLKILDKPKILHPIIPENTSQIILPDKAQQLMEHYKDTTSSDTFTVPAKPNINYA